ncbi:hypothetical protein ACFVS2_20405 [Brevibacillus sp. NPDC058079]|uniref:hypothetical protein n=1 Tax=Brevibacillus sp. NPDC058079 TaxID=3346330 RepID=UPI0036E93729
MSWQILKSPDDKYCIWSTIVEDLIFYDMTADDIFMEYKKKFGEENEKKARKIVEQLNAGEKPYFQFTLTFEEAMEQRTWNKSEEDLRSDVEYNNWISKQMEISNRFP